MLGEKCEVIPYDFTTLGWEAKYILEAIHELAHKALVEKPIYLVWPWSLRTKNMFLNNKILTVGNIIYLGIDGVNNLVGCGFKVREEIHNTFRDEFNIKLNQWNPERYWEKYK